MKYDPTSELGYIDEQIAECELRIMKRRNNKMKIEMCCKEMSDSLMIEHTFLLHDLMSMKYCPYCGKEIDFDFKSYNSNP